MLRVVFVFLLFDFLSCSGLLRCAVIISLTRVVTCFVSYVLVMLGLLSVCLMLLLLL